MISGDCAFLSRDSAAEEDLQINVVYPPAQPSICVVSLINLFIKEG